MKDSGLGWLGHVPSNWVILPSKRLFCESKQLRLANDFQLTPSQKYGVVTQEEYMRRTGSGIVLANTGLEKWRHVQPNDFIISLRSFQGGLEMSEVVGCVTWHYIVLRHAKTIVPRYYKYLFKDRRYITALQQTCSFIRDGQDLRYTNFIQVPIPYPPLDEQQRIADYLDERCAAIDEVRHTIEDEIEALRRLRKATIHRAVTKGLDEGVPMRDSGVKWIGKIPKHWTSPRTGYVVRFHSGDALDSKLMDEDAPYEVYGGGEAKGRFWKANQVGESILVSRQGATCGTTRYFDKPIWATEHALVARLQTTTCARWIAYWLGNANLGQYSVSAAQPGISATLIERLPIAIPPLSEQQRIADYLDERCAAIDSVIDTRTKQLQRLDDYRRALIFAYVTGKKEVPTHA